VYQIRVLHEGLVRPLGANSKSMSMDFNFLNTGKTFSCTNTATYVRYIFILPSHLCRKLLPHPLKKLNAHISVKGQLPAPDMTWMICQEFSVNCRARDDSQAALGRSASNFLPTDMKYRFDRFGSAGIPGITLLLLNFSTFTPVHRLCF
jgi:hypothetical protein